MVVVIYRHTVAVSLTENMYLPTVEAFRQLSGVLLCTVCSVQSQVVYNKHHVPT